MIAIPFAVMLAAACLLVAMSGTLRSFVGQPAAKPARAPHGRHARPATGVTSVVTFGRNQFGTEQIWRYHTVGGAR